jgi:hypothetical protein
MDVIRWASSRIENNGDIIGTVFVIAGSDELLLPVD